LIDCVSDLPTAAAKNPTALESKWAAAVSQLIFNMSVTSLRVHQVNPGSGSPRYGVPDAPLDQLSALLRSPKPTGDRDPLPYSSFPR